MFSRRLVLALVCLAAVLVPASSRAENFVIQVTNQTTFEPSEITIQVGDTVTFEKGVTSMGHNVRSDAFDEQCTFGPTCFRCSLGGCQGQGGNGNSSVDPWSVTLSFFEQPGTYGFHCQPHQLFGMVGRIIVEEDDSPPPPPPTNDAGTIRFGNSKISRGEGAGPATIQVERVNGDEGAVGVTYKSVGGGSATSGADFTAVAGVLSWADGEDGAKAFTLPIAADVLDESDETIKLALEAATGGAHLGSPSTATVTILDDDGTTATGAVAFSSASFGVAETAHHATLTVSRTGSSVGAASVEYDTSNGTATAGQDYTAVGGTLEWASGETADKALQIPILDDADTDGSETLSVVLSQPVGAVLGSPAAATVNVFDDESVPPCVDGQFQACLLGRFLATIHWLRPNNAGSGEGRAIKLTDSAASFEFFEPGNVEVVLKMKDACALPAGNPLRGFWPFVAGLTNVRVELTIIDTESGAERRFYNALGQPFFTPASDSPDGQANPPGAIQAATESLGAFATCDP